MREYNFSIFLQLSVQFGNNLILFKLLLKKIFFFPSKNSNKQIENNCPEEIIMVQLNIIFSNNIINTQHLYIKKYIISTKYSWRKRNKVSYKEGSF